MIANEPMLNQIEQNDVGVEIYVSNLLERCYVSNLLDLCTGTKDPEKVRLFSRITPGADMECPSDGTESKHEYIRSKPNVIYYN